jgi:hypothetical protein
MKRAAQWVVLALCLGFSIASVINVFGDNAEAEQMSKALACEGIPIKPLPKTAPPGSKPSDCSMVSTKTSRTPFGQSFEYTGEGQTRHVKCTRSAILFGAYSCARD